MRNRPTTRRSFLTAAGAVAVAVSAGCQGDGDEGDNGTTTDDNGGAAGTEAPQPRGELVTSETITDQKKWEVDLAAGDTITAVVRPSGEYQADGDIHTTEDTGHLVGVNAAPHNPETMQYTAEEEATYVVKVSPYTALEGEGDVEVEIYVASV